jgi:L-amino acid N-acyltransferase YncA
MIGELVDRYGVRMLTAVLKRENGRSLRLLERLGFSLASAESHAVRKVDADEVLMQRQIDAPTP